VKDVSNSGTNPISEKFFHLGYEGQTGWPHQSLLVFKSIAI